MAALVAVGRGLGVRDWKAWGSMRPARCRICQIVETHTVMLVGVLVPGQGMRSGVQPRVGQLAAQP